MASSRTIRVLTLADERYAMPLAAMGRSLLENHRSGRSLLLRIIDGGITPETREKVERSWRDAAEGPARWEWVSPVFGRAGKLPVWGRMPALTYARLFLDRYFDDPVERAVLLDSDTLVLTDIADLHDAELEGHVLGACIDPFIPTFSAEDGLPAVIRKHLPADTPYFNAGVMVADLRAWKEENVAERALDYVRREGRRLRQYDQDALNLVLAGRWKELSPCWHTHPRTPNALGVPLPSNPLIVHFSGRLKPWMYPAETQLDQLFLATLRRTEWRDFRVPNTWTAHLWRLYDSPVRRLLHPAEARLMSWWRALQQARVP